ncbi:hypothetical protein NDU88_000519 [Pleurodeles waltl]|uniref:Uncharacterized protein n=1 Tax=Pleurodeles waltl TaxID=8319 RepID=A0AAV7S5W4_PLEWA|nr:hypothetical protein NDU88_000519 [Pleurodeles waltl]
MTQKHPRERCSRLVPCQNRATRRRLRERDRPLREREEELRGGDRRRRRGNREKNSGGRGTKTIRKTPGPVSDSLESNGSPDSCGFDNVKRITGPGEHTNEPATLQEKRGQARYGNSGRGERSGKREEDGEGVFVHCTKGGEGRKPRVRHKRGGEGVRKKINRNTGTRRTGSHGAELRK